MSSRESRAVVCGSAHKRNHSKEKNPPEMSDATPLRIVLLGKSVSENSRVGNFILGRSVFDSEAPPDVVERVGGRLKHRRVILINSPQLLHTNISDHQITQTARECVSLSDPGPHVVLLLLQHEQCSAEDQERVEKLLDSFSERLLQHSMVLSTQEPTETNEILQKIIHKCSNRHFSLQRSSSPDDLLQALEDIEQSNEGRHLLCAQYEAFTEEKQRYGERLNVVVCGSDGSLKSSISELIQQQTHRRSESVRTDVDLLVNVLELPALFNTGLSEEEVMRQTLRCVSLCHPGVHAFLLIIPDAPLNNQDRAEMEEIKRIFSSRINKHLMLLIKQNSEHQTAELNEETQAVIESFGGRHHFCGPKTQVSTLMENIEQMLEENRGGFFSTETFLEAQMKKLMKYEEMKRKINSMETHLLDSRVNTDEEVRIVLLGKTGVGKSATGNTILGRKAFKAEASFESVTKVSLRESGEISGRQVTVIDTPGLFDTELTNEEIQREIRHCISMILPGPHVFIIVLSLGQRFTKEEETAVKIIQEMFGENSLMFTMVLFTRGDDLGNKTIEQCLGKPGSPLMNLIEACGNRFHVFNNNQTEDRTQVSDLLEKIDNMVKANGGSFYSCKMFREMERERQEQQMKILMDRVREAEEEMKKLEEEKDRMKMMMEEEQQNHETEKKRREEELKREIREEEKHQREIRDQMKRERETFRHEIEEMRKEKEKIKTEKDNLRTEYQTETDRLMNRIENERQNHETERKRREEEFNEREERYKRLMKEREEREEKMQEEMKREREEWEKLKEEEKKRREEEDEKGREFNERLREEREKEDLQSKNNEKENKIQMMMMEKHEEDKRMVRMLVQVEEQQTQEIERRREEEFREMMFRTREEQYKRLITETEQKTSKRVEQVQVARMQWEKQEEGEKKEEEKKEQEKTKSEHPMRHQSPVRAQTMGLNLVLLGTRGAGKSASGNTILGRQAFRSKSPRSVTRDVTVESGSFGELPVTVYDTPGLSDTDMSEEEIQQMINEKVLQKCESERCVFLLVIKADRFTEEERKTVEKIEKILGEKHLKNTWILFTRGDQLEEENMTIQEFIDETEELKTLVQKYDHRYHVFNNRREGPSQQAKTLLTKILKPYLDIMAGGETLESNPLRRKRPQYAEADTRFSSSPSRRIVLPQADTRVSSLPSRRIVLPQADTRVSSPPSRRIVLVGKSGVGKSAAGNTILGQREFTSGESSNSVTSVCSEAQATVSGRSVSVVDTPGLFDTQMNLKELMMEIARSVYISSPGPHAFLIVFPVNMRFTEQEQQIPQITEMMFGEEVLKYSIILFTHGDLLEGTTIEKLIEENSNLRDLVLQCGGRYQLFNSKDLNNREQVNDLLQKIDSMIQQNGGGHYSNQLFEDAYRLRQEEEKERLREEEERNQQEKKQKQEEIERVKETEERTRREYEHQWRKQQEEKQNCVCS